MANNKVYQNGDVVGVSNFSDGETYTWRIRKVEGLLILTVQSNIGWGLHERVQSASDINQFAGLTPEFLNSAYIPYLANNATLNKYHLPPNEPLDDKYTTSNGDTIVLNTTTTPINTLTGDTTNGTSSATTGSSSMVAGINSTYLIIGAVVVVLLLILKKK